MHGYNIVDKYRDTLKDIMIKRYMPIPHEWKNKQEMTIFDKAYFGIIPEIDNHKSGE